MPPPIEVQANRFATTLTSLFRAALGPHVSFTALSLDRGASILVGPAAAAGSKHAKLAMTRRADSEPPPLLLSVEYQFRVRDDAWLAVARSTFGLWINAGGRHRPVVRIEYDRYATSKPPAHVHFHAESTEVGWLYGQAGLPVPRVQEFHFPLGGRRFRPTIEDFVGFIDRERIFQDWYDRPLLLERLQESQAAWEAEQAKATARRFTDDVIEYLQAEGYKVIPPAGE